MQSKDQSVYLLMDGTYAAAGDCEAGKDGVWRHQNGVKVALDADGNPMTIAQVVESSKNVEATEAGKTPAEPEAAVEEVTPPEPAPTRTTATARGSRAEADKPAADADKPKPAE